MCKVRDCAVAGIQTKSKLGPTPDQSSLLFLSVLTQCYDEGQTRLVDNNFSYDNVTGRGIYSGRVEVCYNGTYGSVCRSGWDQPDAEVVCRYNYGDSYGESLLVGFQGATVM